MAQSIYGMIYDELDAKRKHGTAEEWDTLREAYDLLNREAIDGLILDGATYWIEWPRHWDDADDIGVEQLQRYLSGKGYKYLYDLD